MRVTERDLRRLVRSVIYEGSIDQFENQYGSSIGIAILDNLRNDILEYIDSTKASNLENSRVIDPIISYIFSAEEKLGNLILEKIRNQLESISEKTRKERLILNRLAPNHFSFDDSGFAYQSLRNLENETWKSHSVFTVLEQFKEEVKAKSSDILESLVNDFIDQAINSCRDLGI